VCFLKRLQETPAFLVTKVINAVPQNVDRGPTLKAHGYLIARKTGHKALDNFTLYKRKKMTLLSLIRGKRDLFLI